MGDCLTDWRITSGLWPSPPAGNLEKIMIMSVCPGPGCIILPSHLLLSFARKMKEMKAEKKMISGNSDFLHSFERGLKIKDRIFRPGPC